MNTIETEVTEISQEIGQDIYFCVILYICVILSNVLKKIFLFESIDFKSI